MHHYDNERQLKIAELVITVKLISLVFLAIAVFIKISDISSNSYSFLNIYFSTVQYRFLLACISLCMMFVLSVFLVRYYQNRFVKITLESKKQVIYDIIEISIFIILNTSLILVSGLHKSPYKIIFFFIMISVIIQHGVRYGVIVSAICSSIILVIDLLADHNKPNPSFQIDLILVGAYLTIAWLVGYYRSVEEQYSLKMANLANRDDLTGLYSHGYFQLALSKHIDLAVENNKQLSLLFIDIDYFKYFNDLFGHQAGDDVLKQIGNRIEVSLKPGYIAARYGGEEFTVIMYDASEAEAVYFADNLRRDIEGAFVNKFAEIKKITVSIGVSTFPIKAKNKDELIKCADDALYRAKSFHRNRVETYQSVLEELKKDLKNDDMEIISTVKTLISIINSKDKYTYRHIERVVIFCGLIADELGLSEFDKKMLKYGAYLHDIGKIDIPQEVLNKKMPLTSEEWDLLKQHPKYGIDIIHNVESLADTIPIILYHHERYDGRGYPENLTGEKIPYLARILTIVDSFDAMTSNRPYSVAKTFDEGIQELQACSATQFDPELVKVFIKVLCRKKNIFQAH